jgi:hypothetical protein
MAERDNWERKMIEAPRPRPGDGAAVRASRGETSSPTYTEISRQVARLLRAAEQIRAEADNEAAEIRAQAEADAVETTKRLTEEAELLRAEAEAHAQETRLAAEAYAREKRKQGEATVADAEARAANLVQTAEEQAEAIVKVAHERHDRLHNEALSLEEQVRVTAGELRRFAATLEAAPETSPDATNEEAGHEPADEEVITDGLGPERAHGLFSRKGRQA